MKYIPKQIISFYWIGLGILIIMCFLHGIPYGEIKYMIQRPIIAESHWDGGTKKEKYFVKKNRTGDIVKEGLYVSWHKNGMREWEIKYSHNKANGVYRFYSEDGEKMIDYKMKKDSIACDMMTSKK